MKIVAYPADKNGCGYLRLIWPCEVLREQGIDVEVVETKDRHLRINYDQGKIVSVDSPDCDVVMFQRVCDRRLLDVIKFLREKRGIAVVVDVDDDLSAIHPANPAWQMLDPNRAKRETDLALRMGKIKLDQADYVYSTLMDTYKSSWLNLIEACKLATLVTVSTPGLLRRYAAHGRGMVVSNYIPDHYFTAEHTDNDVIGWPAALLSHPNDPPAVGNAIARLVSEGVTFATMGNPPEGVGRYFGMNSDPVDYGANVEVHDWHQAVAQLGIGIAPLADTRFNMSKSWLKPLEMSAVGVPWVASPRDEYKKINKMGAGILADKPKVWYRELRRLVDDPHLRNDLAAAGRDVAWQLRLSSNAYHWAEAWDLAFSIQRQSEVAAINIK